MKHLFSAMAISMSIFSFAQIETTTELQINNEDKTNIKQAEYPGGIQQFYKDVGGAIVYKYPYKGQLKALAEFMIDEQGNMATIKVSGNNNSFNKAVEKAYKKNTKKWIPGENKEEKTKTYFRQPFIMNFD